MALEMYDYLKEQALNPEWEKATRVHDWRNHVSERIKEMWNTFTDEQKFALVDQANEQASNEHWE